MNPYQSHSKTSKIAAEQNVNATRQASEIFRIIHFSGIEGRTGDELSSTLGIVQGTISARLRGLEMDGIIVKTTKVRPTRSSRPANVYVTKSVFDANGLKADVKKDSTTRLETENELLKAEVRRLKALLSMRGE